MSTSIVVYHDSGKIGRLNVFDDTDDVSDQEIRDMADRWRTFYGPATKVEVVKTMDRRCQPNFAMSNAKPL